MDLSGVQAVLLDMDGTLVDSDAAVERAWRTWAQEYRVEPGGAPLVAHGMPAVSNVRRLRPDLSDDAAAVAAQRQLELQYDDVSDVTAAPGARELLADLDRLGLPWAVVTSADPTLAKVRLAAARITPGLLVTSEDVRTGKPDPEGYLLAARQLGADPRRSLVVEDAEAGVAAGRAAGATVAALKGVPADIQIDDLHQLGRLLRAAAAGDLLCGARYGLCTAKCPQTPPGRAPPVPPRPVGAQVGPGLVGPGSGRSWITAGAAGLPALESPALESPAVPARPRRQLPAGATLLPGVDHPVPQKARRRDYRRNHTAIRQESGQVSGIGQGHDPDYGERGEHAYP